MRMIIINFSKYNRLIFIFCFGFLYSSSYLNDKDGGSFKIFQKISHKKYQLTKNNKTYTENDRTF